jgi:hypothetical protein
MDDDKVRFQVGSYFLNHDPNFNYQLNRTLLWSGGDLKELQKVGGKIKDTQSWEKELIALGEKALTEDRITNAIAYFRMAEFFMFADNPEKLKIYNKARDLFYDYYAETFKNQKIMMDEIPYETGYLQVWHAGPPDDQVRDILLINGGFDSYLEEFLPLLLYLQSQGYSVYVFEGPGQGRVIRKYKISFASEWEKPVKAVLDFYHLDEVTAIGISLGGMLTPRAAAFEPRIRRVVGWSILPNFLDVLLATRKPGLQRLLKCLLRMKLKKLLNLLVRRQMAKDPMMKWGINHGIYIFGVKTPYDFFQRASDFQISNVADQISQDFLLLGAKKDHFIPLYFYKQEIDALTKVHSLTFRVFTEKEQAESHCNIGNMKLVLDFIIQWIECLKARDGKMNGFNSDNITSQNVH